MSTNISKNKTKLLTKSVSKAIPRDTLLSRQLRLPKFLSNGIWQTIEQTRRKFPFFVQTSNGHIHHDELEALDDLLKGGALGGLAVPARLQQRRQRRLRPLRNRRPVVLRNKKQSIKTKARKDSATVDRLEREK